MSSLKGNIVLNAINTITGIIFPIITFPYVSRILSPEGVGAVNFLSSIVQYIVLLTSVGIPMYAVREIAKKRDDVCQLQQTAVEIILLALILCFWGYIIVYLLGCFVPRINEQKELFYILSATILFTCIGVEWFYRGIENFEFITIRAIFVRVIAALSLFAFVQNRDDVLIYGVILVGSSVGNNIINFIHLRKYISIRNVQWGQLNILRHVKPALHIFILSIITSIYVNLDSVMLGFIKDNSAVGLYSAGVKLSHVVLSVVTSVGAVMIPRSSSLLQKGDKSQFDSISKKAIKLVIFVALPSSIGLILLSDPIINIFCGDSFIKSVPVLRCVSPIILFVGITNVIGLQVLYPQGKENIVIYSVAGGAVINVVLNLCFIPIYAEIGAAIATFMAEFIVLVMQIVIGRKYIPFRFRDCCFGQYATATLLMSVEVLFITNFVKISIYVIVLSVILGALVYYGYLIWKKDEIAVLFTKFVLRKQ